MSISRNKTNTMKASLEEDEGPENALRKLTQQFGVQHYVILNKTGTTLSWAALSALSLYPTLSFLLSLYPSYILTSLSAPFITLYLAYHHYQFLLHPSDNTHNIFYQWPLRFFPPPSYVPPFLLHAVSSVRIHAIFSTVFFAFMSPSSFLVRPSGGFRFHIHAPPSRHPQRLHSHLKLLTDFLLLFLFLFCFDLSSSHRHPGEASRHG